MTLILLSPGVGTAWIGGLSADGRAMDNGKGHTVMKFNQDGKLLMTLGKPVVAGTTTDTFNAPSDILVAPNSDIFVADGHGGDTNNRIVKFTKDGKYIKEWGKKGAGPGEFDTPHRGRLRRERRFLGNYGTLP